MEKTKKKRLIIIFSILLGAILLFVIAILVFVMIGKHNEQLYVDDYYDAREIAIKEFDLDEVLVTARGLPGSSIIQHDSKRYHYYVLGLKDNEEVFIVVPRLKKEKPYQIDWVFNKSFREIIDDLNTFAGETVCEKKDYADIDKFAMEFIDHTQEIAKYAPAFNDLALDVDFMIRYHDAENRYYGIVQSDGEIIIDYCK